MSKRRSFFYQHGSGILRAIFVAGIFFAVAWLIPDNFWRAAGFAIATVIFLFARIFSPPGAEEQLVDLKESVEKMAEGDLQILQPTETSSSTVHDFSVSVLVLNSRLRHIVDKVKNVVESVGQTSEDIVALSRSLLKTGRQQSDAAEDATGAMGEMNAAIRRIASAAESLNDLGITASSAALELTASIEEVTRNASQVAAFARDTQVSMIDMVGGIKEIEAASEMLVRASRDTDVSMQNMQRSIAEVTHRASESDELAERASVAAKTGGEVVADVEYGMQKIADAFGSLEKVIANLVQRSEQIGEILNVITQVADQTNLLSLNAAILSAQAGPHGKGFAVVADEIRKLSNRTASSVQEIEKLISRVRIEIKEAVDQMEAGKSRLSEGFERSGKASDALAEILASTGIARKKVAAITEASLQQIQAEKDVQQATATIKQRLDQIIRIIKKQALESRDVAVKAERMIDLLHNVEKGMEDQTHGAKEVSGIVEHLSGIIQSIHVATSEQTVTSSEVLRSVDSLRNTVHASTSTIRSLNSTALSLDQESFILKHELSSFRLPQPKSGGHVRVGVAAKLATLDPAFAQFVFVFEWVYPFYEGLVEFGEGTDIQPCLAERWEISEDGLVYTFKLKQGVRFHNGKELTAKDVKDSFERILNPRLKSPGTWAFEMVAGADEFGSGKASEISGVHILDPLKLRIQLKEPVPFFLGMMAQPFAYVIPSETAVRGTPVVEVCGTGPFKLDRFVPERLIEFSRFENYHAAPMPYVDQVTAEFGMPEAQIAEGLESGKLHFTTELQKQYLSDFLARAEWRPRFKTNVQLHTSMLALNCRIPPLSDVRVRQGIAYAIDRDRIVKDVVGVEQGIVARSLLPPGLPGYDPNAIGYAYDPSRARGLLRQAGVPAGTKLEVWHAEAASNRAALHIIQENLKDVGIDLLIRDIELDVIYRAMEEGSVPLRMTRWVADYPDPDNFLYVTFHSKSSVYNIGFGEPEFDRLVEIARSQPDIQERIRLYQRAERIWMQECPCVCLYHNRAVVLHQESVHGCVPHFTQPVVRLKKFWFS